MAGFELLSDQGLRLDGRKAGELRRIACRMGVFGQADGSAYLEQGNTKVLAAVYYYYIYYYYYCYNTKVLAAVYGPHDMSRDTRLRPQHDLIYNILGASGSIRASRHVAGHEATAST